MQSRDSRWTKARERQLFDATLWLSETHKDEELEKKLFIPLAITRMEIMIKFHSAS